MSNAVQVPHDWFPGVGNINVPTPKPVECYYKILGSAQDTYQQVSDVNDMVTLNAETWIQYNKMKHDHLIAGIEQLAVKKHAIEPEEDAIDTRDKHTVEIDNDFFDAQCDAHEDDTSDAVDCHFDAEERTAIPLQCSQ
jgi:hypothetical protein